MSDESVMDDVKMEDSITPHHNVLMWTFIVANNNNNSVNDVYVWSDALVRWVQARQRL